MEQLVIRGQRRLKGEVAVSGAKNAVVAIIPAAMTAMGVSIIENLPCIEDVTGLVSTLNTLGAVCEFIDENTLRIDARNVNRWEATTSALGVYDVFINGDRVGRKKDEGILLSHGGTAGTIQTGCCCYPRWLQLRFTSH